MPKTKKKIVAIILASTISLVGGEYAVTEISVDNFQKDLETFEMSTTTAENIARYSKGGLFNGVDKLNPSKNHHKEYARACNEALEIFRRIEGGEMIDFGSMTSKEILKKCDGLISDPTIQDYRRSVKESKPLEL